MAVSEDEFWEAFARRSGLSLDRAQPCYCGEEYCTGWVMMPKWGQGNDENEE